MNMKEKVLRPLEEKEVREILGFIYLDEAARALGWTREQMIGNFTAYLHLGRTGNEQEQKFFDFLIELTTLTFALYKWGALLYNLEVKHFSNRIVAIKVNDRFCIMTEASHFYGSDRLDRRSHGVILADIENGDCLYQIGDQLKSQTTALLLYLYEQEKVGLELLDLGTAYDERLSGSYVAFDQERAKEQAKFIDYIRYEFKQYKTRLEELQDLFYAATGTTPQEH